MFKKIEEAIELYRKKLKELYKYYYKALEKYRYHNWPMGSGHDKFYLTSYFDKMRLLPATNKSEHVVKELSNLKAIEKVLGLSKKEVEEIRAEINEEVRKKVLPEYALQAPKS